MEFEWDDRKEYDNIQYHGIRFSTAEHVFDDPFRIERRDNDSSDTEERWQTMGMAGEVLFVVYTERGDVTRIMSARVAEPFERRIYHGNSKTYPNVSEGDVGWHRVNP